MPLIVRIAAEDLAGWEPAAQSPQAWHYRPRTGPEISQEMAERIQLIAPAPLADLVDKDMVCFVNTHKGWFSEKIGERPEVKFQLRAPREEIRDSRRLRLKIKEIDQNSRPPRVILEEYK